VTRRLLEWVTYAKRPFGGAQQVIDYLGRYTNRIVIANRRLIALEDGQVRFRWKDYRQPGKPMVMTLHTDEFIRRFLLHALPDRFRRIRHFGFLANAHRTARLAGIRRLRGVPLTANAEEPASDYRARYAFLSGHALDSAPAAVACLSRTRCSAGPIDRPRRSGATARDQPNIAQPPSLVVGWQRPLPARNADVNAPIRLARFAKLLPQATCLVRHQSCPLPGDRGRSSDSRSMGSE